MGVAIEDPHGIPPFSWLDLDMLDDKLGVLERTERHLIVRTVSWQIIIHTTKRSNEYLTGK